MNKTIYTVKDRWHPEINKGRTPEVRSDNPRFKNDTEFFGWILKHGGSTREAKIVKNKSK